MSNRWRILLNSRLSYRQLAIPERCQLCAAPADHHALCISCYDDLPWLTTERCPQCALPTRNSNLCGACLKQPPQFDSVTAAFSYAWPLAQLIHHYKYAGNLALARLLGNALAKILSNDVDVLIAMPLSVGRLRERGFNQALELARVISRATGIAIETNACRRVRDSAPQALLPWSERAKNIRAAFVCDVEFKGKRVAVIDDVMTTGATLNELARNLRRAGASAVHGWMVARTL